MSGDGEAVEIFDELEKERRVEVAVSRYRIVPNFRVSFVESAVRLTRGSKKHEVRKLMDVGFDVSFDTNHRRRH